MQYYRCECGKLEMWGSMSSPICRGCPECGTTLQTHPDLHRTPAPHDWVRRYDELTGEPYELCRRCDARRSVPTAAQPPAPAPGGAEKGETHG